MKITKIQVQKNNKNKVNIYVDEVYNFSLSINFLISSAINVGDEIDQEKINLFKKQDGSNLAFLEILRISTKGIKTEKEFKDRLRRKEFTDEDIESAVIKAKDLRYIDDQNYAECYIRDKCLFSKWGERKITSSLIQKGIPLDLIKSILEELINEDIKIEQAKELADKKRNSLSKYDEREQNNKIYAFLISRGFTYDIISKALSVKNDN